jgi:hypothetical protein
MSPALPLQVGHTVITAARLQNLLPCAVAPDPGYAGSGLVPYEHLLPQCLVSGGVPPLQAWGCRTRWRMFHAVTSNNRRVL